MLSKIDVKCNLQKNNLPLFSGRNGGEMQEVQTTRRPKEILQGYEQKFLLPLCGQTKTSASFYRRKNDDGFYLDKYSWITTPLLFLDYIIL